MWRASAGYDLAAASYERWYWRRFWETNEVPLIEAELTREEPLGFAIDVGTGSGLYAASLSALGAERVVGLDVSAQMLRLARLRAPRAQFVHGSVEAAPFTTTSFDLAVVCRVLSHVPSLEAAFAELERITRPGGRLIFSDVAANHDYVTTRIPTGSQGDVHIETYKYTKEMIVSVAQSSGCWRLELLRELSFKDLPFPPAPGDFPSIDESSRRPIFNYGVLRRVETPGPTSR